MELKDKITTIPVDCGYENDPDSQEICFDICPRSREAVLIFIKNPTCNCSNSSVCTFAKLGDEEAFCEKIPEDCRETVRKGLMVLMEMVNQSKNKIAC